MYTDSACTDVAKDAQNGNSLSNLTIKNNATGASFYLVPGAKYYYTEVLTTEGYEFDHLTSDDATFTDDEANPEHKKIGVIDLTAASLTQPDVSNSTSKIKEYTVYNKPIPRIILKKESKPDGANLKDAGAKFKVYTRDGEGTEASPYVYKPYPNAEEQ